MKQSRKWGTPVTIVVLIVAAPIVIYVMAYLQMGDAWPSYRNPASPRTVYLAPSNPPPGTQVFRIVRRYPKKWQREIFRPAGRVEALVRGIEIYVELPPDDEVRDLRERGLL